MGLAADNRQATFLLNSPQYYSSMLTTTTTT
jgi:hypothetical protein